MALPLNQRLATKMRAVRPTPSWDEANIVVFIVMRRVQALKVRKRQSLTKPGCERTVSVTDDLSVFRPFDQKRMLDEIYFFH